MLQHKAKRMRPSLGSVWANGIAIKIRKPQMSWHMSWLIMSRLQFLSVISYSFCCSIAVGLQLQHSQIQHRIPHATCHMPLASWSSILFNGHRLRVWLEAKRQRFQVLASSRTRAKNIASDAFQLFSNATP